MLDKAIKYGKEKRKPLTKSKAIDRSCWNHGSCPWCRGNRLYNYHKRKAATLDAMIEFLNS